MNACRTSQKDEAGSRFKGADGHVQVENISLIATPALAYSVDIERSHVRLAGTEQFARDPARAGTDGRRAALSHNGTRCGGPHASDRDH